MWSKGTPKNFVENRTPFRVESGLFENLEELTEYELFWKLFSMDLLEMICEQSVKYARLKNNQTITFQLDTHELKVFISILLLSGYHTLLEEKNYWSVDEDLRVKTLSVMP